MAKQRAKPSDKRQFRMEVVEEKDVGIDPHKKTLTASVLDRRGGVVSTATFKVSGVATAPLRRGHSSSDPSADVCPTRTAEQSRKRRQGKTDALDSVRIAREVQTDPGPAAGVQAGGGRQDTSHLASTG